MRLYAFLVMFCCISSIKATNDSISTIHLDEVTINARRLSSPYGSTVVTPDYVTNLEYLLDKINDISTIRRGAYGAEPIIKGFNSNQINLTVDGMKIHGACTDKMDPAISYFESENLNSITIFKNVSQNFNGNNIGGNIDLKLREPMFFEKKINFQANIGFESIANAHNAAFTSSIKKDNFSYLLSGTYRKSDNYRDGSKKIIQHTGFEKYNAYFTTVYQLNQVTKIKLNFLNDVAKDIGYAALPMDASKAELFLVSVEILAERHDFFRLKTYFNKVEHEMDDSKRDSLFLIKKPYTTFFDSIYMRMDMPGNNKTYGAFCEYKIPITTNQFLHSKIDYFRYYAIAEMKMKMFRSNQKEAKPMYFQTWPESVRSNFSFSTLYETKIKYNQIINLSFRTDLVKDIIYDGIGLSQISIFYPKYKNEKYTSVFSFNIAYRHPIFKLLTTTLTLGYNERYPTTSEKFSYFVLNAYDNYDYLGNPFLKKEKSYFVSCTFDGNYKKFIFSLSCKAYQIHNYILGEKIQGISPVNIQAKGVKIYKNAENAHIFQSSLNIRLSLVSYLSLDNESFYTLGILKSTKPLPHIPPFENRLIIRYIIKHITLELENETAFSQKHINKNFGEIITPGYTLINTRIQYMIRIGKTNLISRLSIENLFDKAYRQHLDWENFDRPGRNIKLQVIYQI